MANEKGGHQFKELKTDPLSHLETEAHQALARHENTGGCFTIIGPVKICWTVNGSNIKVCLQLAGVNVTCANIDPSNPCVKLEGNVLLAKASVEVCLKGNCLTYKAQACYRPFPGLPWKCTSASGNIICF